MGNLRPSINKSSPYLKIGSIATAVAGALGIASIVMFLLTAVILGLAVAFILLKVTAIVTFGWGWVFAPVWIPILFTFSAAVGAFVGCYLINAYIFVKRLCTDKIGK